MTLLVQSAMPAHSLPNMFRNFALPREKEHLRIVVLQVLRVAPRERRAEKNPLHLLLLVASNKVRVLETVPLIPLPDLDLGLLPTVLPVILTDAPSRSPTLLASAPAAQFNVETSTGQAVVVLHPVQQPTPETADALAAEANFTVRTKVPLPEETNTRPPEQLTTLPTVGAPPTL